MLRTGEARPGAVTCHSCGMRGDRVVWLAALAVVLARFPSLLWPLRPDEAGFLLVARAWDPQPDSLYGHYWVDRPPQVIALMRLSDAVGGPYAHRAVGALGCGLLVLVAAAAARELVRTFGPTTTSATAAPEAATAEPRRAAEGRVAAAVAVVTAALVANAEIDAIGTKGELLGIPLVTTACWLALRAVRTRSWLSAFLAGLAAVAALGMKQSLAGGLIFGGVLLLGAGVTGALARRDVVRLGVAAAAGGTVPVAATVAWALDAGVRLETLWYVVVAFRSDASEVIASQSAAGPAARTSLLALVFFGTGMAVVLGWYLVRLPGLLRQVRVPTVAVLAMLVVDVAGVVLSGSFWLPYLFALVPGLALATACVLAEDAVERTPRSWRRISTAVVGVVSVSSVLSLVGWTGQWALGAVPHEVRTGLALREAGKPGDTLVVYGGRADIQWASGMSSPYPYLWSLPMRTLDPGLADLRTLLTGRNPPDWVVTAVEVDTWTETGTRPIERSLLRKYEFVVTACDRYRVFHLNSVNPVRLDVDCRGAQRLVDLDGRPG